MLCQRFNGFSAYPNPILHKFNALRKISTHPSGKKPAENEKAPPQTRKLPRSMAVLAFKMCEKPPFSAALSKK
jgi:hypothetical protein